MTYSQTLDKTNNIAKMMNNIINKINKTNKINKIIKTMIN